MDLTFWQLIQKLSLILAIIFIALTIFLIIKFRVFSLIKFELSSDRKKTRALQKQKSEDEKQIYDNVSSGYTPASGSTVTSYKTHTPCTAQDNEITDITDAVRRNSGTVIAGQYAQNCSPVSQSVPGGTVVAGQSAQNCSPVSQSVPGGTVIAGQSAQNCSPVSQSVPGGTVVAGQSAQNINPDVNKSVPDSTPAEQPEPDKTEMTDYNEFIIKKDIIVIHSDPETVR